MDQELFDLARRVGQALLQRGVMLASAESCTGGWIGECVTMVPGSSQWFDRGFVTYTNDAKQEMLGVAADTLGRHGAVSEQTVAEMAAGALARSHAGIAVAVSGVAGPTGGSPQKPVGTVCIGWAVRGASPQVRRFHFDGDRAAVRRQSVVEALHGVLALMDGAADGSR